MLEVVGHALLAFAAGAALGAAALYAAWVYLLPIGTVSDVVSEDRAIASYVLLFSFHIVSALFDQCTGAFRDARTWEKRPDAREYRLLWPAFLAFWIATHSPLAFTGSYYFAYWSLVDRCPPPSSSSSGSPTDSAASLSASVARSHASASPMVLSAGRVAR